MPTNATKLTLYIPDKDMVPRWRKLAKKNHRSLGSLIIHMLETAADAAAIKGPKK